MMMGMNQKRNLIATAIYRNIMLPYHVAMVFGNENGDANDGT